MTDQPWQWDPTLYAGSAAHYARGRVPYDAELIERLLAELRPGTADRLLDIGCGPGSLTLPLAPAFGAVVGLDADAQMLAEAADRARAAGIDTVTWVHCRAEDLDVTLGPFDVVTLAQSFHWMDRPKVATLIHHCLTSTGHLVHVHATTHRGIQTSEVLPYPQPPHVAIDDLVRHYLGPRARAGRGLRPRFGSADAPPGATEAEIYQHAGFARSGHIQIPGVVVTRSVDDIVSSVFSLSSSTPPLFHSRLDEFESELRELLGAHCTATLFSEQLADTTADIWRPIPA